MKLNDLLADLEKNGVRLIVGPQGDPATPRAIHTAARLEDTASDEFVFHAKNIEELDAQVLSAIERFSTEIKRLSAIRDLLSDLK